MWRIVPGQSLAFREWDDEVVLFNDLSGSTHLLDGAALDVLHALRAQPQDAGALTARLAAALEPDDAASGADPSAPSAAAGPADLAALVDAMLASLARLDLVEPC